ncbi:translation initiation factor [Aureliella helgolandensis]|uniref:Translation initiation factor Sui1 n=1 Tax=Aureliella helgolandensis TaxID=2527968 RepID=A0A518G114_9BACT|nr:translation initiation factor [Aureliella helgolandensis]QDV22292.1 translation initiation factor Sui1 [Aureliella helgolandensis]
MGLFDGTPLERPIHCDRCGLDEKDCRCAPLPAADVLPSAQRLQIRVEKRKRGKLMTVVKGFECQPQQLQQVLTTLKNHCGAGGTTESMSVEIQGQHLERAQAKLRELGYRV